VLQKVKDVVLVPAPSESDEADKAAREYFRTHADGKEHLLVYNGELHDATLYSTRDRVWRDPEIITAVVKTGKPMVFFHNHPVDDGRAAMFPSHDDFGVAGLLSSLAYREDPGLTVEFRIVQPGKEGAIVAYGFKGSALEDIRNLALEYRSAAALKADVAPIEMKQNLLDYHLAQDSYNDYLQYACPLDLTPNRVVCRTHPQYFTWPSSRFFIHYRPQ
jgi:hypothetical protein